VDAAGQAVEDGEQVGDEGGRHGKSSGSGLRPSRQGMPGHPTVRLPHGGLGRDLVVRHY
jgi:hypothetical protein